jgi:hypothetical protein
VRHEGQWRKRPPWALDSLCLFTNCSFRGATVAELPTDTVTFLFTDIEGSSRLRKRHPEVMEPAHRRHDSLAAAILPQHGGALVKHRGRYRTRRGSRHEGKR